MELNVVNCLVTVFSRSDMVRPYNYRINGARLKGVDKVRDLDVITTHILSPL